MKHRKFLIIRPDRIGDVVLSTPLPREIKKIYPGSYIAIMLTEYTKAIYINNPFVDEIITFPANDEKLSLKDFFRYTLMTGRKKFDYAFMLLPQKRINYLLFAAGIKYRVGVGHKFYQFITNTKSVYRRKYIPLRHESDYCLDMLRKTGIKPVRTDPEIHLSNDEKQEVTRIKERLSSGGNKIVIGINSTSGNSAPNIKPAEYRKLIDLLLNHRKYSVAVTDLNPPGELDNIPGVGYICRNRKLRESILNIAALDVMVSASTGPMHIASALKIPTVSLFCPLIACSPLLWGPSGNRSRIVLPDKNYCTLECPGDPKKCDFSGTGGIDSLKVYDELTRVLE